MKWRLVAVLAVVSILSAYLIYARIQSEANKIREATYERKLHKYIRQFGVGSTRKQIEAQLGASGSPFHQICCLHGRGSVLTDLVKIDEEKGPWYCSGIWVNVAFDFHATESHDPLKADDADVLDQVTIFREAQGCL